MVESLARTRLADLYLLLDVDVPWVADLVRDSGATRDSLHELFGRVLDEFGATVRTIAGAWDERLRRAVKAIDSFRLAG